MSTTLQPLDRLVARRRSRPGLLLQCVLQWLYLPLWAAVAAILGVVAALASAGFNPPLKWLNPWLGALTWRRFRVEWAWEPAAWDAYATEKVLGRITKAEAHPDAYRDKEASGDGHQLAVTVPERFFRGVGSDRAVAFAASRGWAAQTKGSGRDQWSPGALRLTRTWGPGPGAAA
ncbi:hypothetical protein ACFYXS_09815 [Streptomyces sp. NPDC002574]|uniref:hypothetical protein n=1 Tax=Streptomyces sp. NPDC002574 TaxID=3364652 RepID=UPI0036B3149F